MHDTRAFPRRQPRRDVRGRAGKPGCGEMPHFCPFRLRTMKITSRNLLTTRALQKSVAFVSLFSPFSFSPRSAGAGARERRRSMVDRLLYEPSATPRPRPDGGRRARRCGAGAQAPVLNAVPALRAAAGRGASDAAEIGEIDLEEVALGQRAETLLSKRATTRVKQAHDRTGAGRQRDKAGSGQVLRGRIRTGAGSRASSNGGVIDHDLQSTLTHAIHIRTIAADCGDVVSCSGELDYQGIRQGLPAESEITPEDVVSEEGAGSIREPARCSCQRVTSVNLYPNGASGRNSHCRYHNRVCRQHQR